MKKVPKKIRKTAVQRNPPRNFRASISQGVVFHNVRGEHILLDLPTGNLYSLNEIGSQIWDLMKKGLSSEEIIHQLTHQYDVTPQVARAHLLELVDELEKRDLARVESKPRAPSGNRG